MIQTVEPCGKRSLVGRQFVWSGIAAILIVRAVSHCIDTHAPRAIPENAPPPTKTARTILTAKDQVKIA